MPKVADGFGLSVEKPGARPHSDLGEATPGQEDPAPASSVAPPASPPPLASPTPTPVVLLLLECLDISAWVVQRQHVLPEGRVGAGVVGVGPEQLTHTCSGCIQ